MIKDKRNCQEIKTKKSKLQSLLGKPKPSQKSIDSHNISNYSTRKNPSGKTNSSQSSINSSDSQEYITNTYKLLKHYYKRQTCFFLKVKKYLSGEWQARKKKFWERLNTISYLQNGMETKNYSQIQYQIILQWRNNPILYFVRALWYEHVQSQKYDSIGDFMKQYNLFREFIGQLAFLYFQSFFNNRGGNDDQHAPLDRLINKTSHMIISSTSTWQKLCEKLVLPLLKLKLKTSLENDIKLSKFTMKELQITTIAVDYQAEENKMPRTTAAILQFVLEFKILDKIRLLGEIRRAMDKQIQKRQEELITQGILKKKKTLDKDDFVDCLVYCVVKGNFSLENLRARGEVNNILSKFRCDSHLADLEAMCQFLVQHANPKKSELLPSTHYTN